MEAHKRAGPPVRGGLVPALMSRSTVVHLLHYPVSKAAFILPLPLESAPLHDHGKQTTSCMSFMEGEV